MRSDFSLNSLENKERYNIVLVKIGTFTFYNKFVVIIYLTLFDPLRIQPWSQDRRNQIKSNREQFRRKTQGKQTEDNVHEVASKIYRRQEGRDTEEETKIKIYQQETPQHKGSTNRRNKQKATT